MSFVISQAGFAWQARPGPARRMTRAIISTVGDASSKGLSTPVNASRKGSDLSIRTAWSHVKTRRGSCPKKRGAGNEKSGGMTRRSRAIRFAGDQPPGA